MITLYTFGPAFGLPDPSPFVTKAEVLLKMAGLPYRTDTAASARRRRASCPTSTTTACGSATSTFIRWHLETKYGVDFDRGLSAEQRAIAWAFEKMAEDHLYWALRRRALAGRRQLSERARRCSSSECRRRCGRS